MTTMERAAFFTAAATVDVEPYGTLSKRPADVLDELLTAARDIRLPAYIYDAYGNLVAINSCMRALSILPDALWETANTPSAASRCCATTLPCSHRSAPLISTGPNLRCGSSNTSSNGSNTATPPGVSRRSSRPLSISALQGFLAHKICR
ncbi:MAG: hypothetical protein R2932_59425 [Caldilineaceae bacterium]